MDSTRPEESFDDWLDQVVQSEKDRQQSERDALHERESLEFSLTESFRATLSEVIEPTLKKVEAKVEGAYLKIDPFEPHALLALNRRTHHRRIEYVLDVASLEVRLELHSVDISAEADSVEADLALENHRPRVLNRWSAKDLDRLDEKSVEDTVKELFVH